MGSKLPKHAPKVHLRRLDNEKSYCGVENYILTDREILFAVNMDDANCGNCIRKLYMNITTCSAEVTSEQLPVDGGDKK